MCKEHQLYSKSDKADILNVIKYDSSLKVLNSEYQVDDKGDPEVEDNQFGLIN